MFGISDKVRIIGGGPEIWTVDRLRDSPTKLYSIVLNGDAATMQWKKEDELELVARAKRTDSGDGGLYPADPIM